MTKTALVLATALLLSSSAAFADNDSAQNPGNSGGFRVGPLGNSMTSGVNPAYHRSLRGSTAYNAYNYAPETMGPAGPCAMRFKSFDPASGTYMGFDGRRHPCP